jgi:multicomponent Na+:H+ antiporter subunit E
MNVAKPVAGSGRYSRSIAWTALARGAGFLALWLVLMQSFKPADLAVGLGCTLGATWASLRLLPPAVGRFRPGHMLLLLPRLLWQSVVAGLDVARRAFDPRMPLRAGIVRVPLAFPEGHARNIFAGISSLLPGTVPCGDVDGELIYHCLDLDQPVVEQLQGEGRRMSRTLLAGERHG